MAARRTKDALYDLVLASCSGAWLEVPQIAAAAGVSRYTAQRALDPAHDNLDVECRRVLIRNRWVKQYRAAPDGYVKPLFESRMDARPLADVFGGYTFYTRKESTTCLPSIA